MKAGSLAFSVQHLLVVADFRDMAWVGAVRCNIAARMLSQSGTQREKKHVLKVLLWFCVFCLFLLRFVFMGPLAGLCIGPLPVLFRLSKCRRPCISHNWSSCCGWTCVTTWRKPWRRWKEKKKEKARTGRTALGVQIRHLSSPKIDIKTNRTAQWHFLLRSRLESQSWNFDPFLSANQDLSRCYSRRRSSCRHNKQEVCVEIWWSTNPQLWSICAMRRHFCMKVWWDVQFSQPPWTYVNIFKPILEQCKCR